MKKGVDKLVTTANRERSLKYKVVASVIGALVFLAVVPGALFLAGYGIQKHLLQGWTEYVRHSVSVASIVVGLLLLAWCAFTQLRIGKGTPVPLAATQKLIISGPYRYTRNPMQLGAMIYYFGLGTLFDSVEIGLLMLLFAFLLGSLYNRFVEEKELGRRFGKEYEAYRAKTPFLIPKVWN